MPETQRLAKAIAFYLPQFHRIPENDEWWEPGFTEWTNVRKARPLYKGHQQPRRPGELGYYDLTNADVRKAQAELARDHGISAFCYWHYWFGNGRRILERPFTEVLNSGEPDFPFLLCWANQTWTGVWHGAPGRILVEQTYPGPEDHKRHFEEVLPAFKDRRYFRVGGKPMFLIYMPLSIPNLSDFISQWNQLAHQAGLEGIFFVGMVNDGIIREISGIDAFVRFGPGDFLEKRPKHGFVKRGIRFVARKTIAPYLPDALTKYLSLPTRFEFADLVRQAFTEDDGDALSFPCVLSGWDNTPRSGLRGVVGENFTPALFRAYVKKALSYVSGNSAEKKIIFFKAWNEWAEGNYLEPDDFLGKSLLSIIDQEMKTQSNTE